ncbi:MAG: TIR domain-containing protein, partial [Bacteroidales bacterium]|nr:TIR domain-containing protein [Bacteroidales bacterium]
MNEEKKYFAFISYSHKDKKVAKKLQNFIQGYKIPAKLEDRPDLPKRIGRVFRDEDELVGDELTPQIEEALKQSRYLIVVCSPNSAKSKYVNEEIEYFKSLGGETKILPYIIAGKATTDEDPDCCYAPALRENQKKHQIVGGDAQENGAEAASVKLIAGMLRLEFNTLYDRFRKAEKRKRKIVITAITAFALLMAGVTAWILFLYNDVKESKSIILAENAMNKIEKGDYLGARRNALEAITLSYSPKAERALRQSWESNSGILEGHSNYVNSVSWSPDGKYLASGSADNTVKIWDANNGECIRTLKGHLSSVMSVSWSPDGRYLASGSVDKSIVIWDANSGEKLKTFEGHSAYISSICWSPDGRYLASGAKDQIEDEYIEELFIWDANSGEIIKNFEGHSWGVFSVSWSPDGKYLASSSGGWNDEGQIGEVFIWDVNSGACL